MTQRVKDITGSLYEFTDVDKTLENRDQIIFRFEDKSEIIFMKSNIIYAQLKYNSSKESEGIL